MEGFTFGLALVKLRRFILPHLKAPRSWMAWTNMTDDEQLNFLQQGDRSLQIASIINITSKSKVSALMCMPLSM